MVTNAAFMGKYVRVNALDSGRSIDGVDWNHSVSKCWWDMYSGTPQALLAEIQVRLYEAFGNPSGVNVFVEVSQ